MNQKFPGWLKQPRNRKAGRHEASEDYVFCEVLDIGAALYFRESW